ncbi:MAG TPA: T9SS type A sorting domain-containing protein [Marinilabiliaceae bacterium]|nr:T9SS type A sorting domain-containing protein [Marinilabiliaceae bacterium]
MKKNFTIVGMMIAWSLFFMVNFVSANSFYSISDEKEVTVTFESSTGNIVIATPQAQPYHVKVYDLTGKEVFNKRVESLSQSTVVESNRLQKGLYLIRVVQDGNNTPLIFKVMVQ